MKNPGPKIVIMGDFNDNPPDKSIAQVLKATKLPDLSSGNTLYNPTNNFNWRQGEGSEFYKGEWSRFIQIILSTSLVNDQLGSDGAFP
jgi:hypothetical protein